MIPRQAVALEYPRPSYYGGLLTVYPIVTKDQQYGLFGEVMTDWYGPDSGIAANKGGKGPAAWADKRVYNGEVWTVQRDALPGYYTQPQQLTADARSTARWESGGIGDWSLTMGWQSPGYGPYG